MSPALAGDSYKLRDQARERHKIPNIVTPPCDASQHLSGARVAVTAVSDGARDMRRAVVTYDARAAVMLSIIPSGL